MVHSIEEGGNENPVAFEYTWRKRKTALSSLMVNLVMTVITAE